MGFSQEWIWQYPFPQATSLTALHVFDEKTMIAVGDAGVILSTTNAGIDWQRQYKVGDVFRLNDVCFVDEQLGWAVGTDGALLKSSDQGQHWALQFKRPEYGDLRKIQFANADIGWIVGQTERIIKTDDGGETWTPLAIPIDGQEPIYNFQLVDPVTAWILTYRDRFRLYETRDGGVTWRERYETSSSYFTDFCFADSATGWMLVDNAILKTTDRGESWQEQRLPQNDEPILTDIFVQDRWIAWVACYGDFVLRTTDGGETWSRIPLENDPGYYGGNKSLSFFGSQCGWIVGDRGFINKTTDGGNTWQGVSRGTAYSDLNDIDFVDREHGWAVGRSNIDAHGILLKTIDGGNEWAEVPGDFFELRSVHFIDDKVGWMAGDGIYRTADGGEHWTVRLKPTTFLDVQFIDNRVGWALSTASTVYRLSEDRELWQKVTLPDLGFKCQLAHLAAIDSNTVYLLGFGYAGAGLAVILKTSDGGRSWVRKDPGFPGPIIACQFFTGQEGWIASRKELAHTRDGGNSWVTVRVPLRSPDTDQVVDFQFAGRRYGWLVGLSNDRYYYDSICFFSSDSGRTWDEMPTPQTRQLHALSFVDKDHGWAAGPENAILKFGADEPTDGIMSTPEVATPAGYELKAAYPNPFNGSTVVEFNLPVRAQVTLNMYDVRGQKIVALVQRPMESGPQKVMWDGRNHSGEPVPSGVYFIVLRSGVYQGIQKVVRLQ